MYRRTLTVQKNPTKLFENGLIRFEEVRGLYVPLGLMVEQKSANGKGKEIVVNDNIDAVTLRAAAPAQIKDAHSCRAKVRAVEEWTETCCAEDRHAYFSARMGTGNDSDCFTHFALEFQLSKKGLQHPMPISLLELQITGREMVEDLLKTIPADGSCYPVPVNKGLVEVTVAGEDRSAVEKAANIIYQQSQKWRK